MRSKLAISVIIVLFLGLYHPPYAYSQNISSDFDTAFNTYNQSIENYQKLHDDYVLARAQYLRFGTQKSKTEAKDTTTSMLKARDDVVIDYIRVLEARLNTTVGVEPARRESMIIKLDEEISWFSDHRDNLSSAGDLDDLVSDSDEAKDHYNATLPLFYETLANVSYGRITDYRSRLEDVLNESKAKLDEIRTEDEKNSFSLEKIQTLDRWIFESESLIARSNDKQTDADEALNELSTGRRRSNKYVNLYNEILTDLTDSQQLLKDATSYLGELIKEVKKEN
jgi:hypothetical protein